MDLFFRALRRVLFAITTSLGITRAHQLVEVNDGMWNTTTRRHAEIVDFIDASNIPKDSRILDVGCGPGWLIGRLKRHGFRNLYGCDWKEVAFDEFEYRVVNLNLEGLAPYEDKSFDVVIASDVLEHLENPAFILREVKRVLRPSGHFFLSIPHCSNLYQRIHFLFTGNITRYLSERKSGPFSHISLFTSDILESLTDRAQLRLIEIRGSYAFFFGQFWGNTKHPFLSYCLLYRYMPLTH